MEFIRWGREPNMDVDHHYSVSVEWQGNPPIEGSADRAFRGSPERWNPEELLVAALAECHMLSYLHSAATNGIIVSAYTDAATGIMQQQGNGGHFTSVTLRPIVTIAGGDAALALSLHAEASANCFIAQSVNFAVSHEPKIVLEDDDLS
jgi:organic hydroperoxide reductase OsmC/OhrA